MRLTTYDIFEEDCPFTFGSVRVHKVAFNDACDAFDMTFTTNDGHRSEATITLGALTDPDVLERQRRGFLANLRKYIAAHAQARDKRLRKQGKRLLSQRRLPAA